MKILIAAVGTRMPRWVDDAFMQYADRMPRTARVELIEIRAESRGAGTPVAQVLEAEARRMWRAIPQGSVTVALDERGKEYTSAQFSKWLGRRVEDAIDTAFLIGGPDGMAPSLKSGAELLRLSAMTLPHGLARVLLAEQLYRAASILQNHPYHRE